MLSSSEEEGDASQSKQKKDTLASSDDEDAPPAKNTMLASSSEEDNSNSGKKNTSRAALESGERDFNVFLAKNFQTRIKASTKTARKIPFELYFSNPLTCLHVIRNCQIENICYCSTHNKKRAFET